MIDSLSPFLPEDRKEAQWVFNSLPVKQQMEMVLGNRGKRRMDIVLLSIIRNRSFNSFPRWRSS